MRTTVTLRNIIGVAEDIFLVGLVPLHGQFDPDILFFRGELEHLLVHRRLLAVEMLDECLDATLVFKNILLVAALVFQNDAHTGIEERELAQTFCKDVVVILGIRKNL